MLSSRHINILWSTIIFIFFASELQYPGVWSGGTTFFNICLLLKATSCIGSGARFAPVPCPLPNPLYCDSAWWFSEVMQPVRDKPDSYVPAWDGSARTWRRYCKEVSWYISGTKADHRRYAAAKLITRLTGPARLLSMSWRNRDFEGEQGVTKMLQRFAASPLVRRSLPNAASTMSEYFSFKRKPGEPISQFLVREALGFEEFQEALIQLKDERSGRDPSQREFDLPTITGLLGSSDDREHESFWRGRWGNWRGMGDEEQAPGEPGDEQPPPEGYTSVPQESDPGSPPVGPSEVRRRQDAEDPDSPNRPGSNRNPRSENGLSLMDNFILDVMRGWRLLVAASLSQDEWRDVLATTGNKLDYQSIADALQTLWDDQLGGARGSLSSNHGGLHNNWTESWDDASMPVFAQYNWHHEEPWYENDWTYGHWSGGDVNAAQWTDPTMSPPDDSPADSSPTNDDPDMQEAYQAEKSAEALYNEARRTWTQAQQATAALRRDRGFGKSGKGKGKCFNCGGDHLVRDCPDRFHPGPHKGSGKQLSPAELDAYLFKGKGYGKFKGKSNHMVSWDDGWYDDDLNNYVMSKGHGKYGKSFKGKSKPSMNTYNMDFGYMSSYVLELQPLELFSTSQTVSSPTIQKTVPIGFGMLDCGATASAGPESSAKHLIAKLREHDPDIGVHIDLERRPHFRYGSGQWGRALYHLTITSNMVPSRSFEMYSLPDPEGYVYGWSSVNMLVPILVGMDHLQKVGLILDFSDGHALHGAEPHAEPYNMQKNSKGHYMVDLIYYLCGVVTEPEAALECNAAIHDLDPNVSDEGLGSWPWFELSPIECFDDYQHELQQAPVDQSVMKFQYFCERRKNLNEHVAGAAQVLHSPSSAIANGSQSGISKVIVSSPGSQQRVESRSERSQNPVIMAVSRLSQQCQEWHQRFGHLDRLRSVRSSVELHSKDGSTSILCGACRPDGGDFGPEEAGVGHGTTSKADSPPGEAGHQVDPRRKGVGGSQDQGHSDSRESCLPEGALRPDVDQSREQFFENNSSNRSRGIDGSLDNRRAGSSSQPHAAVSSLQRVVGDRAGDDPSAQVVYASSLKQDDGHEISAAVSEKIETSTKMVGFSPHDALCCEQNAMATLALNDKDPECSSDDFEFMKMIECKMIGKHHKNQKPKRNR